MLLALALISTAMAPPRALELSDRDKVVLLSALEDRVGGRFIVTGLADAEAACAASKSCVTGAELVASANAARASS